MKLAKEEDKIDNLDLILMRIKLFFKRKYKAVESDF